jgi:hypothetical protein
MKKKHTAAAHFSHLLRRSDSEGWIGEGGFSRLCISLGLLVFFVGVLLALFAAANPAPFTREGAGNRNAQAARSNGVPLAPAGGVYAAWLAEYNGTGNQTDTINAIATDDSGNIYVTGQSVGAGAFDYATIKYNAAGQQQWVARYNGPVNNQDMATAIAVDQAGNVYVTGRSPGTGIAEDYATIKYNSRGRLRDDQV